VQRDIVPKAYRGIVRVGNTIHWLSCVEMGQWRIVLEQLRGDNKLLD